MPKRIPNFHYLVMAAHMIDDVPLRLFDTRQKAELYMLELMKARKAGKPLPGPSELCHFYIIEFKDGKPYSHLTETIINEVRIKV